MFNQELTSSEQAYQWRFAKYVEQNDIAAEIMASRTPLEAKDIDDDDDDATIHVPDNPVQHVPDDLTEPAPDAMTSVPSIDAEH